PIVVTGRHLHAVTSARIGGREVRILERVSNTQLSIVATRDARTGSIELTNSVGTTASEATLTIDYPVPVIRAEELPSEVDMFGELTLKGRYMAVVRKVIVTDGTGQGREAEIRSQDAAEVVIRVPYVETPTARITLRYDEADTEAETPLDSAPQIGIVRLVPTLDALDFDRLIVGRITTLRGTNLDQITAVKVGGVEANIASQSAAELRFTVPAVEGFEEGDANATTLTIDYFDGFESQAVCETIPATVLAFNIWEGVTTFCQNFACLRLESFFSPETGVVYHNSRWRTEVDPVSYGKLGAVCSKNNVPSITEEEYNSVNPYFFFSGNTGTQGNTNYCTLQINSPAGSNGQLKNFPFEANNNSAYRLLPGNGYGTPALTFRYLDPAVANEKALADKVRNLDFRTIDETAFPIDTEQKTVAGVNLKTPVASTNSSIWAPGIFTPGVEQLATPVDAVLLVLYYNYKGMTDDALSNVKRIGFVHIVSANYRPLNGVAPALSDVTYNVYWQKEDYKY
ncbi:MAG: DNA-binding protein, partial [Alistipes sp.]|nr:DNA-binding protein [Alistipes sp.]